MTKDIVALKKFTPHTFSWAQKQPNLQDFLTKTRTTTSMVPNLDRKKTKPKTQHVKNKNPTKFYCKE
jgi:hypothetical protein